MMSVNVNGEDHTLEIDPSMPLLWVLRDELGLTGTKYGCGQGICGACTVHIDGVAARSCTLAAERARGRRIVTIEGLAASAGLPTGEPHPVQRAWISVQVPQCGYCQSGMIMAAAALLARHAAPTEAEINAAITNLCRCGTYPRVRRALHALAARREAGR
ncbi:MAG: (2Fe-2S)-binding protein [Alphaproteobacteria bacterium]|nr:(2Fe-2S)-binding protein [Alphaproteobacteria bacterium]